MADWPVSPNAICTTVGAVEASTSSIVVTGTTLNVKGSFTEIIAATIRDVREIIVYITSGGPTTHVDFLIDIAIGSAGNEQIICPNLLYSNAGSGVGSYCSYSFKISIPSGSRISVRCQSNLGSKTAEVQVYLISGDAALPTPQSIVTAYGADLTDSGGTSIDPGGAGNTKGSWVQLSASCSVVDQLLLALGNQRNNTRTQCNWLIDIGVGPAGNEQVILSDLRAGCDATLDCIVPITLVPFPVHIPTGSRIAVRAQCSITDATDRLFDAVIYGVG